jgi:hypothetical protein
MTKHTNGAAGDPYPAEHVAPAPHHHAPTIGAPATAARIRKRLAELHEQRADIQKQIDAYEFVLVDLDVSRTIAKRATAASTIAQAIKGDKARRRRPVRERRADTAKILTAYSTTEPRPAGAGGTEARAVAVLLKHGYLTKRRTGYVRTAKAFTP